MIQCRTIVNNGPLGLVIRRPVRYAEHMRYSDSSWLTAAERARRGLVCLLRPCCSEVGPRVWKWSSGMDNARSSLSNNAWS